ncbi:hypothetical protein P7D98_07960, partial [Enterococcus avium]|nr:hypothetical protein [Enterococcus avium]
QNAPHIGLSFIQICLHQHDLTKSPFFRTNGVPEVASSEISRNFTKIRETPSRYHSTSVPTSLFFLAIFEIPSYFLKLTTSVTTSLSLLV